MKEAKTGNAKQQKQVRYKKRQPKKDSQAKRFNEDNVRQDKLMKDFAAMNDFSWYNKNPNLITGAARIPFGNIVGESLFPNTTNPSSVPGIMSIGYEPTIGGVYNSASKTFDSIGINQAAEKRYSFVVHANSRNQKYDAADLTMTQIAGADVFSMIGLGQRAYGTMTNYSAVNMYLPKALITASGFDFDDLQKNYSHMWFDLNQRINRANQIWIPKDIPLVQRWFWMNSSYYTDANSSKGQIYVFRPESYLVWSDSKATTGSSLSRKWLYEVSEEDWLLGEKQLKWNEYLQILDEMLESLLNSMDRGTMYGDVLKAYGAGDLFQLAELPLMYSAPITYSQEVLSQIENATICPINTSDPMDIMQTPAGVIFQSWNPFPSTTADKDQSALLTASNHGSQVLNFHGIAEPDVPAVTIATRLKTGLCRYLNMKQYTNTGTLATYNVVIPDSVGTEIVTFITMWQYSYVNSSDPSYELIGTALKPFFNGSAKPAELSPLIYEQWAAFDWAPWIYRTQTMPAGGFVLEGNTGAKLNENPFSGVAGDWDVYTWLDNPTLARIHLACELSLWGLEVGSNAT